MTAATTAELPRGRRRRLALVLGALAALAAVGVAIALVDPFSSGGRSKPDAGGGAAPALATVERRTLRSQQSLNGTLGYAGTWSVVNQATGTITDLPSIGQVIRPGEVLYRVDDKPVVLLSGRTPAYRALSKGMSGPDVAELNANLVRLGYATSAQLDPTADYFGSATATALKKLQDQLDVTQTGSLSLGQAVFLPGPVRITKLMGQLGTRAAPGGQVAQGTSTRRRVSVKLDASEQASVKVGDRVSIVLPSGRSTPGVVTSVGKVATAAGGGSGSPTVPVSIAARHPRATGSLDQAPVHVEITTARVRNALVVPVNALLARAGGGYAVETVDAGGIHHMVPVSLGLFDDAQGLVQVSGSLSPGQRVVVPAS